MFSVLHVSEAFLSVRLNYSQETSLVWTVWGSRNTCTRRLCKLGKKNGPRQTSDSNQKPSFCDATVLTCSNTMMHSLQVSFIFILLHYVLFICHSFCVWLCIVKYSPTTVGWNISFLEDLDRWWSPAQAGAAGRQKRAAFRDHKQHRW